METVEKWNTFFFQDGHKLYFILTIKHSKKKQDLLLIEVVFLNKSATKQLSLIITIHLCGIYVKCIWD